MTHTVVPIQTYYALEAEDSAVASTQRSINKLTYSLFMDFIKEGKDQDFPALAAILSAQTGATRHRIKQIMQALLVVSDLENVRSYIEQTWILDLGRIIAIGEAAGGLARELYPEYDAAVRHFLEPTSPMQALPGPRTFAERCRTIRQVIEPLPDAGKAGSAQRISFRAAKSGSNVICEASLDPVTAKLFEKTLAKLQARHDCTPVEALNHLLHERADISVKLHLFQPQGEDVVHCENYSFYPRDAYTYARSRKKSEANGYHFSEQQRAEIQARDGVCRFPGCDNSAWNSDIDHVVPYNDGGKTTPENAQCLCRAHHLLKTRKIVSCEIDPNTFDTKWVMPDGSIMYTQPQGPLAPALRRNAYTLEQMRGRYEKWAAAQKAA